jgi:hypothetical protein
VRSVFGWRAWRPKRRQPAGRYEYIDDTNMVSCDDWVIALDINVDVGRGPLMSDSMIANRSFRYGTIEKAGQFYWYQQPPVNARLDALKLLPGIINLPSLECSDFPTRWFAGFLLLEGSIVLLPFSQMQQLCSRDAEEMLQLS